MDETGSFQRPTIEYDSGAMDQLIRRLPIYLLLDCSGTMAGRPIEAVKDGLETFKLQIMSNAETEERAYIGIITFASTAKMVTPGLVPIYKLELPELIAGGKTRLGLALDVLNESIETHVRKPVPGAARGDYKPLVFILTDGKPTDENWRQARQKLLERVDRKLCDVITVGCGMDIDDKTLSEIAIGHTFHLADPVYSFKQFFEFVTQTVTTAARDQYSPVEDTFDDAAKREKGTYYWPGKGS